MDKKKVIELAVTTGAMRFESDSGNDCITFVTNCGELNRFAAAILIEAAKVCLLQGETKGNCDAHFDAADWCHSAVFKMAKELTQ